ncbi:glycosyl hydrolase family 28-related protein [Xanthomonas sp. LF07-6]|uniref:glycosyl hydrolase family 28-related protein n=1 Tax=Xanthomonas sp. LF07-6 TaxID=3097550 RepID=UPI002A8068D0|nr:glycosyl hydrolase family 28-related protein [Xanthomonas sp. LF07-6]MDY4338793.1 glycosyl hydrolase family 28-related protein [Xanthomonas sp. LF07-6]
MADIDASNITFNQAGAGSVTRSVMNKLTEFVSVRDFGAVGDSTTDDTAAFQRALDASNKVYLPDGVYKVSATLVARPGLHLIGSTPENCRILRTNTYGDTLQVGSTSASAGNVTVSGVFFWHYYSFNNGNTYVPGTSTSVTNRNTTGSHLQILSGQNVRITDCWFEGNRNNIYMRDSYNIWIDRCNFNGIWDANREGLQDTECGIYMDTTSNSTRNDNINISHCRIGGYGPSEPTDVTTNGVTVSKVLNAGIRFGIRIRSAERFTISDNYIGGQAENSILIESKSIVAHGEIHDNMLDGAFNYSILIRALNASSVPNFINIHHNTGVGYGFDLGFVKVQQFEGVAGGWQISINSNILQYYRGCPIYIDNAVGVSIFGNHVSAYNSDGSTNRDLTTQSGCFVGSASSMVHSHGNLWGGGINNPSSANYCRWGIAFQDSSLGTASNERSLGLGLEGGTLVGGTNQSYPA